MCCIIESELLAVWSMSWVIRIDMRESVSRQRDERHCSRVFRLPGCPREEGSTSQNASAGAGLCTDSSKCNPLINLHFSLFQNPPVAPPQLLIYLPNINTTLYTVSFDQKCLGGKSSREKGANKCFNHAHILEGHLSFYYFSKILFYQQRTVLSSHTRSAAVSGTVHAVEAKCIIH